MTRYVPQKPPVELELPVIWKRPPNTGFPYTSLSPRRPLAALTTRTASKSASSSSATIVASPVWMPWPISIWLQYTTIVPSSRNCTYGRTGSAQAASVNGVTSGWGGAVNRCGRSSIPSVAAARWIAARMRG